MDVDKLLADAVMREEGIRRLRAALADAHEMKDRVESYVSSIEAWLRDLESAPATKWPDSREETRVAMGDFAVRTELAAMSLAVHNAHKKARRRCAFCGDRTENGTWCGACNPQEEGFA